MLRNAAWRARRCGIERRGRHLDHRAGRRRRQPELLGLDCSIAVARETSSALVTKGNMMRRLRPCPARTSARSWRSSSSGAHETQAQAAHAEPLARLDLEQFREPHLLGRDVEGANRHFTVAGVVEHRAIGLDLDLLADVADRLATEQQFGSDEPQGLSAFPPRKRHVFRALDVGVQANRRLIGRERWPGDGGLRRRDRQQAMPRRPPRPPAAGRRR